MSEKHRADRILQQLEILKAEMARQDQELEDAIAEAGIDQADLEDAQRTFADYLRPSVEPSVHQPNPLAFTAMRA